MAKVVDADEPGFFKRAGNAVADAAWRNRSTLGKTGVVAGAVLGTGAAGYYAYRKVKSRRAARAAAEAEAAGHMGYHH